MLSGKMMWCFFTATAIMGAALSSFGAVLPQRGTAVISVQQPKTTITKGAEHREVLVALKPVLTAVEPKTAKSGEVVSVTATNVPADLLQVEWYAFAGQDARGANLIFPCVARKVTQTPQGSVFEVQIPALTGVSASVNGSIYLRNKQNGLQSNALAMSYTVPVPVAKAPGSVTPTIKAGTGTGVVTIGDSLTPGATYILEFKRSDETIWTVKNSALKTVEIVLTVPGTYEFKAATLAPGYLKSPYTTAAMPLTVNFNPVLTAVAPTVAASGEFVSITATYVAADIQQVEWFALAGQDAKGANLIFPCVARKVTKTPQGSVFEVQIPALTGVTTSVNGSIYLRNKQNGLQSNALAMSYTVPVPVAKAPGSVTPTIAVGTGTGVVTIGDSSTPGASYVLEYKRNDETIWTVKNSALKTVDFVLTAPGTFEFRAAALAPGYLKSPYTTAATPLTVNFNPVLTAVAPTTAASGEFVSITATYVAADIQQVEWYALAGKNASGGNLSFPCVARKVTQTPQGNIFEVQIPALTGVTSSVNGSIYLRNKQNGLQSNALAMSYTVPVPVAKAPGFVAPAITVGTGVGVVTIGESSTPGASYILEYKRSDETTWTVKSSALKTVDFVVTVPGAYEFRAAAVAAGYLTSPYTSASQPLPVKISIAAPAALTFAKTDTPGKITITATASTLPGATYKFESDIVSSGLTLISNGPSNSATYQFQAGGLTALFRVTISAPGYLDSPIKTGFYSNQNKMVEFFTPQEVYFDAFETADRNMYLKLEQFMHPNSNSGETQINLVSSNPGLVKVPMSFRMKKSITVPPDAPAIQVMANPAVSPKEVVTITASDFLGNSISRQVTVNTVSMKDISLMYDAVMHPRNSQANSATLFITRPGNVPVTVTVIPSVDMLNTSDGYTCSPTASSSVGGACTVALKSTAYAEPQEDKVFQVKATYGGNTVNKTFTYYSRRSINSIVVDKVENNCLVGRVGLNKVFPALPNYPAYDLSFTVSGKDQSNRDIQLATSYDSSGFSSGQQEKGFTICSSQPNAFTGRSGQNVRVTAISSIYQSMLGMDYLVP